MRESGPRGWFLPILEASYTRLRLKGTDARRSARKPPSAGAVALVSALAPDQPEAMLADVPPTLWLNRLQEYKRRKVSGARALRRGLAAVPGPAIPGARNWSPLGPSVVLDGQAHGLPPVAGRISGIAVAAGGQIVYAASANGGVFRSEDGGVSWRSLMDAFDMDPTHFASTSLACGAIAIDMNRPERVYVGTGEGDTHALFGNRVTNALPAYRGIGPIISDDGGQTWEVEPTAAGSPDLAGKAFFSLAVDPNDPENVVGATSEGLYQRIAKSGGGFQWIGRRTGVHSSVAVATNGNTTRFFAAEWGQGVYRSTDGAQWSRLGTGFPTSNVGRIAIAVQNQNPDLVYAMVANTRGALQGVYRCDSVSGPWKRITGPPDVLPADNGSSQGDYDLAIAVDPMDADLIFMGGSYYADQQYWPAAVWQCRVQQSGAGYKMNGTPIGMHAHADVHVLTHTPGEPHALWVGCDGGVFLNRDPRGSGTFTARNNGLACLCTNFFSQHPTDPNILFCGLQDNGTARTGGGPIWNHVNWGDGGYCLVNWANPQQVLVFANGTIYRATDGGMSHASWTAKSFDWSMMTEPIVGAPYNPSSPADANIVGLGEGRRVHISRDFGKTWPTKVNVPSSGGIFSMVLASKNRVFVGTTEGEVFRLDYVNSQWKEKRIDDSEIDPLPLAGLVSDIAVDWADPALESIYVAFGGMGDYRHVWHFDGTRWENRSGPAGNSDNLLDVEHNAIVVDPHAPENVYVGADIGVWHSADAGMTWETLPNGLPDAPVFDVQLHPTRRLLRASTHGRGLFEWPLDAP